MRSTIVITDEIRSELRIDDATTERGTVSIAGQVVTFNIPYLYPGESIQMTIVTTVLTSPFEGTFDNVVTLTGNGPNGEVTTRTTTALINVPTDLPATGYAPVSKENDNSLLPIAMVVAGVAVLLSLMSGALIWRRTSN